MASTVFREKSSLTHLDELFSFYEADKIQPAFFLSSMGFTEELAKALTTAGFYQAGFDQAVLYGLPATTASPPAIGITVEIVNEDSFDLFLDTNLEGFEFPTAYREGALDYMRRW